MRCSQVILWLRGPDWNGTGGVSGVSCVPPPPSARRSQLPSLHVGRMEQGAAEEPGLGSAWGGEGSGSSKALDSRRHDRTQGEGWSQYWTRDGTGRCIECSYDPHGTKITVLPDRSGLWDKFCKLYSDRVIKKKLWQEAN